MPITERLCWIRSRLGSSGVGSPRGTSPTRATPCEPRSNTAEASRPPTTSTSAPGIAGARNRNARMTASATPPTRSVVQWMSSSVRDPGPELLPCVVAVGRRCPVSFGSSPITTSTAAPARKPVTTAFERNCAIQPSLNTASSRNSSPVASVIAATSCAACAPPRPVTSTAPPATAASDELGPVEICRDVQKSA